MNPVFEMVSKWTGARAENMRFCNCGSAARAFGIDGAQAQHPDSLGVFDFESKRLLADWRGKWRFHFYK